MSGSAPKFLGRPSPSLKKMRRMNRTELSDHIKKLQAEADQLKEKVDRLKAIETPDPQKMVRLQGTHRRLSALVDEARRLYTVAYD